MMDRREALLLIERLKRRTRDPDVLTLYEYFHGSHVHGSRRPDVPWTRRLCLLHRRRRPLEPVARARSPARGKLNMTAAAATRFGSSSAMPCGAAPTPCGHAMTCQSCPGLNCPAG